MAGLSSASGITLDGFSGIKPMIILMDPPRQAELRRVLQKAFTAKRIGAQESLIRHTARTLLDAIPGEDKVDLVSASTAPFPIVVIAEMLGVEKSCAHGRGPCPAVMANGGCKPSNMGKCRTLSVASSKPCTSAVAAMR
jgi:cytochrome P450